VVGECGGLAPPQKLAENQTLASSRYLNWDTE